MIDTIFAIMAVVFLLVLLIALIAAAYILIPVAFAGFIIWSIWYGVQSYEDQKMIDYCLDQAYKEYVTNEPNEWREKCRYK